MPSKYWKLLEQTKNAGPTETYGQAVVNRINFARGRIHPSFQVNASADADVYKSYRKNHRLNRLCTFIGNIVVFFFSHSVLLLGQSNTGELRLRVTDPSGLAVKSLIQIISEANQYRRVLSTDDQGTLTLQRLPYGVYQLQINQPGFAEVSQAVDVHSSIPTEHRIQLRVLAQSESVTVRATNTLINPDQAGYVNEVGSKTIQDRVTSLPGRSLQDLVSSQPGWFYEGNAVLHPRESEYQTQFVVDGIPLTDNRSPSFGPVIEADDVQSLAIYTAGFPAEYGR